MKRVSAVVLNKVTSEGMVWGNNQTVDCGFGRDVT